MKSGMSIAKWLSADPLLRKEVALNLSEKEKEDFQTVPSTIGFLKNQNDLTHEEEINLLELISKETIEDFQTVPSAIGFIKKQNDLTYEEEIDLLFLISKETIEEFMKGEEGE